MKLEHFLIKVVAGSLALVAVVAEYTRPAQLATTTEPSPAASAVRSDVLVVGSLWIDGVGPTPPHPVLTDSHPAAGLAGERPNLMAHEAAVTSQRTARASRKPAVTSQKTALASQKTALAPQKTALASRKPAPAWHKPAIASHKWTTTGHVARPSVPLASAEASQPPRPHLTLKQKFGKLWIGLKSKLRRKPTTM